MAKKQKKINKNQLEFDFSIDVNRVVSQPNNYISLLNQASNGKPKNSVLSQIALKSYINADRMINVLVFLLFVSALSTLASWSGMDSSTLDLIKIPIVEKGHYNSLGVAGWVTLFLFIPISFFARKAKLLQKKITCPEQYDLNLCDEDWIIKWIPRVCKFSAVIIAILSIIIASPDMVDVLINIKERLQPIINWQTEIIKGAHT